VKVLSLQHLGLQETALIGIKTRKSLDFYDKKQELVPGFPGRLRFFLIFCGGRREFKETVASSDKEVELDIVVANIFFGENSKR